MSTKSKTKSESVQNETTGVCIKLIHAEGVFKGLVLDLSKVDGRLLYIGHGLTADEAWQDAQDYLDALTRGQGLVVWA